MNTEQLQQAYNWAIQHGYEPQPAYSGGPRQLPISSPQPGPGSPLPMSIADNSGVPITPTGPVYGQMSRSESQTHAPQSSPSTMQLGEQHSESEQHIYTQPTVFESMLVGHVQCRPIYSDEVCGVVVDANPMAPLHLLIFPKVRTNMQRLTTITEAAHGPLLGHMIVVAKVSVVTYYHPLLLILL